MVTLWAVLAPSADRARARAASSIARRGEDKVRSRCACFVHHTCRRSARLGAVNSVRRRSLVKLALGSGKTSDVSVALTREADKNGPLRDALHKASSESAAHEFDVLEIPCITHAPGLDSAALKAALEEQAPHVLGEFGWVLVTSPEAANVLTHAWAAAGRPRLHAQIAAVGAATSRALDSSGMTVSFVPSVAFGKQLAEELPTASPASDRSATHVLYPASARAKSTVQEGLELRGFAVTRWNVYDTVAAQLDADAVQRASLITVGTFASPSAVSAWHAAVGALPSYCACIGKTSADRCIQLGA
eukprot:CAMPEP_0185841158 /NCGR_PEP_ID=MMETSP1353-20130828/17448_1 /TAXON_ID=1077150 /ORGANISM="Erythrolobus australicus, Strain CCMP3124" /LENGTH=303 /DNA_ID=CAMNT_0028540573 /DNA_START=171 /DNA_END=1079 /DNA_ORIENTATION=+